MHYFIRIIIIKKWKMKKILFWSSAIVSLFEYSYRILKSPWIFKISFVTIRKYPSRFRLHIKKASHSWAIYIYFEIHCYAAVKMWQKNVIRIRGIKVSSSHTIFESFHCMRMCVSGWKKEKKRMKHFIFLWLS